MKNGKLPKPLEYIEYVMDQMGFTQSDLARKGCGYRSHISEMLRSKRKLTLNFIRKFLHLTHREKMAYLLIKNYKLKNKLQKKRGDNNVKNRK